MKITDFGSGIPKEIQGKLFNYPVRSQTGTGIGLFLAKKVILKLGGNLNVSSIHGTTQAFLTLPMDETSTQVAGQVVVLDA